MRDALAPTLQREGVVLIPSDEHLAVVRAIFEHGRETLGIDLAEALPLELAGLWSFLLRSSSTFGDMLRRAERYMRLVNRHSEFLLDERGDLVAMVCPHPDPSPCGPRQQVVCALLGHWIACGRQLTRASFSVEEARFRSSAPRDRTRSESFFGGRIEFGADEDALLLRCDVLRLSFPEQTPELIERFEAYACALIRRMTPESSIVERVREAIIEGLLTGSAKEAVVAKSIAGRRAAAGASRAHRRGVVSLGLRRTLELPSRFSALDWAHPHRMAETGLRSDPVVSPIHQDPHREELRLSLS